MSVEGLSVLAILSVCFISAIAPFAAAEDSPDILPVPKKLMLLKGRIQIAGQNGEVRAGFFTSGEKSAAIETGIAQINDRIVELGGKELPVVSNPRNATNMGVLIWIGTVAELPKLSERFGVKQTAPEEMNTPDGYVLRCTNSQKGEVVVCLGYDKRGCYYALQTLIQLLDSNGGGISFPRVEIVDWPTYRIRLVKNSGTKDDPEVIERFADLLPRYKINVYALQYHNEKDGTWRQPSERYSDIMEKVGDMAQQNGVLEPGFFLCPFLKPRIDTTDESDIEEYLDRLRWGIRKGFKWLEVDFNDWSKWEYLSEAEKSRFADIGEFMAHLTNAVYDGIRRDYPDIGIIVCPVVGWYQREAKPELAWMCKNIPQDVLVYWTGPVVRSRRIEKSQVEDWTQKTGRKPFLWDNTIYAHFQPYWVGYAFNPFSNEFPDDFPDLLAGPGIHMNANGAPHYAPGMLTFADYMWNPEAYDPERSIKTALRLCWGKEAPEAAQDVQYRFIEIYKMLYNARKSQIMIDRERAEEMLSGLEESVKKLSEIANDPVLAAYLDTNFVVETRKAVENFRPDKK